MPLKAVREVRKARLSSPFVVDDIWVGWGKSIRKRLGEETAGTLPVDAVAKHLARELRAG
jgi:hypothetical protein